MDGYLYNLDPYRQASAGYSAPRYPSSYSLERRSSYGLPASDTLARLPPLDPYSGYGVPSYQRDVLRGRYGSTPISPGFRPRPRTGPKRKPSPSQSLGPKKKPFKQTSRVRFSDEKSPKKPLVKKAPQGTSRVEKPNVKAEKTSKSQTASLAKETLELHKLFRTGVDPRTGKKVDKVDEILRSNGEKKKRKAETETHKDTPAKGGAQKKLKGKKNKNVSKDKRNQKPAEKIEPVVLTEEEKKEAELALQLQRGLCNSVCECLGGPPEMQQAEPASESDVKPEDSKETVVRPVKLQEPDRSPEEETEAEERSRAFFSKLFEDNQELCKLYVDKCNSGSFECLVCYSTEAKSNKQFWNLVSLAMHCRMTKSKRPEHRGYGRAMSPVLGWDYPNLPRVPRGQRSALSVDKAAEQVQEVIETDGKKIDPEEKAEEKGANDTTDEGQLEESTLEVSLKVSAEE